MVSIQTLMQHKTEAYTLLIFITLQILLCVWQYRLYNKRESNFKYIVVAVTLIMIIISMANINTNILKGYDLQYPIYMALTFFVYFVLDRAYRYLANTQYYVKESYTLGGLLIAPVLFAALLLAVTPTTPVESGAGGQNSGKPPVATQKPTAKGEEQAQETQKETPTENEQYCAGDFSKYILDCYDTEKEFKDQNLKDDVLVKKYNSDIKLVEMTKTNLRESEMTLKFLTAFGEQLTKNEPDNPLLEIVQELKDMEDEKVNDFTDTINQTEPPLKVIKNQLDLYSKQDETLQGKIANIQEIPYTTTLFEKVNAIFELEDETLMKPATKSWVYEYIEQNEVE